jgi:hypothetical protein
MAATRDHLYGKTEKPDESDFPDTLLGSIDEPQQEQFDSVDDGSATVISIRKSVVSDIWESIATNPKLVGSKMQKKAIPFLWTREGTQTKVYIPSNIETYKGSPMMACAIAACYVLKAKIIPCEEDLKVLPYISGKADYLWGIASAFKQYCSKEGIVDDKTTGLYHQGFRWALAQGLAKSVNAKFHRLTWDTPWSALIGRNAWEANASTTHKMWYSLILEAARHLKPKQPSNFFISWPEIRKHFVRTFPWESGAVFSSHEVSHMKDHISKAMKEYQDWLAFIEKNLSTYDSTSIWQEYLGVSKRLRDYANQVEAVASIRARLTFTPLLIRGRKVITQGQSRDSILAQLSLLEKTAIMNPTGLFNDDRIELLVSQAVVKDDDATCSVIEKFLQRGLISERQGNPLWKGYQDDIRTLLEAAGSDDAT